MPGPSHFNLPSEPSGLLGRTPLPLPLIQSLPLESVGGICEREELPPKGFHYRHAKGDLEFQETFKSRVFSCWQQKGQSERSKTRKEFEELWFP